HGRRGISRRSAIHCVSRRVLCSAGGSRVRARIAGGRGAGGCAGPAEIRNGALGCAHIAMAADGPGVLAAMKYDLIIDGTAATLSANGERFAYQREGGERIESNSSAAAAGDGILSILIDGRSYAVTVSDGEVSV